MHLSSTHVMPFAGMRYQELAEARVLLGYIRDEDDHAFRGKMGVGSTLGIGLSGHLNPRVPCGPLQCGANISLLLFYGAGGTIEQHYYEDNPDTIDDERDIDIPDGDYYTLLVGGSAMAVAVKTF